MRRHSLILAVLFFLLLVAVGSIPGKASAVSAVVWDKYLHLGAYGVLSALIYLSTAGTFARRALVTLTGVAVLGLIDELVQMPLPYRSPSLSDWTVDVTAAVLWLSACAVARTTRRTRRQPAA